jgi:hypothetical protein
LSFKGSVGSAPRSGWGKLATAASAAAPPVILRKADRRDMFRFMAPSLHRLWRAQQNFFRP